MWLLIPHKISHVSGVYLTFIDEIEERFMCIRMRSHTFKYGIILFYFSTGSISLKGLVFFFLFFFLIVFNCFNIIKIKLIWVFFLLKFCAILSVIINEKKGDAISDQSFPALTLRTAAFLPMTVLHQELLQQREVVWITSESQQALLIWRAAWVGR